MSDLEFVAFSDDGKMIILQGPDGNWIEVPIKDSPGSYAVPEERPTDVELSPREIQSRIRAGISPAELAASTNSSLERIMSFAPPILLERSHVASKATRTVIRRASGSGTLGDIVNLKLESLGIDLEETNWDSYRREDGRWSVLLHYPADGATRTAAWLYDVRNNALVAADEDARWLTGDQHRQTSELIAENTKVTEVVEFLAPVTQLTSRHPQEQPTDTIPTEQAKEPEAAQPESPEFVVEAIAEDPALDELLSSSDQEADTNLQPTLEVEPEKSNETSEIRPPRIPSWDEILFGPANPEN